MKQLFKKIAITTGDPRGVGLEVAAKALYQLGPQPKTLFFIFRDVTQEKNQPRYFRLIDQKFTRLTFASLEKALAFANDLEASRKLKKHFLFDIAQRTSAAHWILDAITACRSKKLTSLVTGPLSKTLIKKSGFSFIGHTGAFRQIFPSKPMHMAFAGKKFNVLLASDHIPLETISKFLTPLKIKQAISSARKFQRLLGSKKPIALLGLNPHAGEGGLLGHFESKCLKKLASDIHGPLVPDAAFFKSNWSKYSVFICLYHDQGLIPFKMVHGQDSGVHITVGLPFVRTSVDHGTAFDIYNKNLANPASMLDAIKLNLKLTR
ncbi:MAG: hypothetical protein A2622_05245 [Bdellovibrionales bacterium RIFCSPHIGHO2_01_FULL_40_29]|nr:MAG: hypothetical protein A2622_05245 [Bdellovibrionales bacterium RIFCSPHIGHO2_01_FULL_40_29]OFZ34894.1 MAG: hypothetical protein A3D17_10130 [Bdellovibrionales bacterium RIFCSPHIGHO2_02_FULL_40_15]